MLAVPFAVMAATRVKHGTLVANQIDTVSFDFRYRTVEVVNLDSSARIYFTTDGSAPSVAGDDVDVVPPSSALRVVVGRQSGGPATQGTTVKLVSTGTPAYSVSGDDESSE